MTLGNGAKGGGMYRARCVAYVVVLCGVVVSAWLRSASVGGNGETPPAGVAGGVSICASVGVALGCALVHAARHDDYLAVAVVAGGGVVVGFGGVAVGVGDVVGGAGEAVELFGCHAVGGGAGFFWCGE